MRRITICAFLALLALPAVAADWLAVEYGELVDRRQLSHSGESVGRLLQQLGGRAAPSGGERPDDRLWHSLLDPLIEPYAFVLPDAVDASGPGASLPWIEVGRLWAPGEVQPAWGELLRSRRWLVESDGAGRMRVFLPLPGQGDPGKTDPAKAVEEAYRAAWPVLRSVFHAELRRLRTGSSEPAALDVAVHAYRHRPEATTFHVTREARRQTVSDLRSDGFRPPLDLEGIGNFLASGWWIEGARLEPGGGLRLLGSRPQRPASILGRPLTLADLAVAYRAVFHGGLAEPYMSLDRGFSPQTSIVNYGGRLRDTRLGMVSLLCDIRFKTFSLGIDISGGDDVREAVREKIPGFRTHLERFAYHPDAQGIGGQQTRMWFYPDQVDLTVSPQGDLLAMRRVRMSASSERVLDGGASSAGGEPPWTKATVQAINEDYDALAAFFPELADLDQVVRLLSLFTWLKQAAADGLLIPDMDVLLDVPLPAVSTPRAFPQLLAFNALPDAGARNVVDVFDQVPVAEALERLRPAGGRPLPARRRLQRALASLDDSDPQNRKLLEEMAQRDVGALDEDALDVLAYRAERLRMHQTVLATLPREGRRKLAARQQAGEQLRVFSVGIGGLDLGMGQALDRARGRSLDLGGGGFVFASTATAATARAAGITEARAGWRVPPPGAAGPLPEHGLAGGKRAAFGDHRARIDGRESGGDSFWTVLGTSSREVTSRRVERDGGRRAVSFDRVDGGRFLRYRFEGDGDRTRAVAARDIPAAPAGPVASEPPAGLALIRLLAPAFEGSEPAAVPVRLRGGGRQMEAAFPRRTLQRLTMGAAADLTPGQPLPGLSVLPPQLGAVETAMVMQDAALTAPPWEPREIPAGEEDGAVLARALGRWWRGGGASTAAVVGTDPQRSPARWFQAPEVAGKATLVLPAAGFDGIWYGTDERLAQLWNAGPVARELPAEPETPLVVVISAEPPALLAARLRRWSEEPALNGKLLAVWSLSGPLRTDLPARLLVGGTAGVGIADTGVVGRRNLGARLADYQRSLSTSAGRVEGVAGPFVWYF